MSEEEETIKIALTMAKLNLQWWIKKNKESETDYSHRIQFAKFKTKETQNGKESNN